MRWFPALLALLLAASAMPVGAGSSPEIGFVPGQTQATVANRGSVVYAFPLSLQAADGETTVNLEFFYLALSESSIAPTTQIRMRPQDSQTWTTVGSLSGFGPTVTRNGVPAGSHQVEATVTITATNTSERISHLSMYAQSPGNQNSRAGVAYPFTFNITNGGPTGVSFSTSKTNLQVSFDAAGTDPEGGPVTYAWEFGDGATGTGETPTHAYATGDTYQVNLTVHDDAGVAGTSSQALSVTAAPPTQVQGLKASSTSSTSIELTWTAATGDQVTYEVYRSTEASFVPPGQGTRVAHNLTATAFNSTGLAPETEYHYRVRAVDKVGQLGPFSALASNTTLQGPDETSPSAPGTPQAGAITSSSIAFNWTAATDNRPGTLTYRIWRDGSFLATTQSLAYTDTGLAASGTYRYKVQAVDAAGNAGTNSSELAATTSAAPGGGGSPPPSPSPSPPPSPPPSPSPSPSPSPEPAPGPSSSSSSSSQSETQTTSPAPSPSPSPAPAPQPTPQPLGPAPKLRDVTIHESSDGRRITWETDIAVDASIALDGTTFQLGRGVRFELDLLAFLPGEHQYTIQVTTDQGVQATLSGSFVLRGDANVTLVQANPVLASAILDATATSVPRGSFFLVRDAQGIVIAVEDASGTFRQIHGIRKDGLFLLAASNGQLVLVDVVRDAAFPVEPVKGIVVGITETEVTATMEVTVGQKEGWIMVSVPDKRPGQPIIDVERGDGKQIGSAYAWRSDGKVHLLDDPSYTYRIFFDNAVPLGADATPSTDGDPNWALVASILGVALLVLLVAIVVVRRKA